MNMISNYLSAGKQQKNLWLNLHRSFKLLMIFVFFLIVDISAFAQPPVVSGDCGRNILIFDGIDDEVAVSIPDFSYTSGTVEAWVRKDNWQDAVDDALFSNGIGHNTTNSFYVSFHPSSGLHFRYGSIAEGTAVHIDNSTTSGLAADSWHHVAATWHNDGAETTLAIYMDGDLVQTTTAGNLVLTGPTTFGISRGASGSHYVLQGGAIAEMRVWEVARTETQIADNMNDQLVGDETNLIAYWPLDDGAGASAANLVSGSASGTLTNMDPAIAWASYPMEVQVDGVRLAGGNYDFGLVEYGYYTANVTFTLINKGQTEISFTNEPTPSLSGDNPGSFAVNFGSTDWTLSSGESTTFQGSFIPSSSLGLEQAMITFSEWSGCSDPYTVHFRGTGATGLSYLGSGFNEDYEVNDGSVEGSISITVSNDTFQDDDEDGLLDIGSEVTITGIPDGLTPVMTINSSNNATLTLTGNALSHQSADDVSELVFDFDVSTFTNGSPTIAGGGGQGISFTDNPFLIYSGGGFTESAVNDGSVTGSIDIDLSGDIYQDDDEDGFLDVGTQVVLGNIPAGLTPVLTLKSSSEAELTLTGNATSHQNTDDVADITFTFTDAAFNNNMASQVLNATGPVGGNLGIDFTDPFITSWQTTTANESITIPTTGTGYSYIVDWGDGTVDETTYTGDATHEYAEAGTYTVSISGDFPRIYFNYGGDIDKIRTIEQWGAQVWTSMAGAFAGCYELTSNATDAPNLSNVTDMSYMFQDVVLFDADVSDWDVSSVTDMAYLFEGATAFTGSGLGNWDVSSVANMTHMLKWAENFNADLSGWDVSSVTSMTQLFSEATAFTGAGLSSWDVSQVTDMSSMFSDATIFNADLSNWDVSLVTNMSGMFQNATAFNADLSGWDVGNVTNMSYLFRNTSFTADISGWDVSKVTNMSSMLAGLTNFNIDLSGWDVSGVTWMSNIFYNASSFNADLSDWDVSQVTSMSNMFNGATAFNQNLGSWDISSVSSLYNMFNNSGLTVANYEATLNGWADDNEETETIPLGQNLGTVGLTWCDGTGRDLLTGTYFWSITDDGQFCQANDDCSTAVALTVYPKGDGDYTEGSTESTKIFEGSLICADNGTVNDVWYKFNVGASGTVEINTTLGTASSLSGAVYISCGGDDYYCEPNIPEQLYLPMGSDLDVYLQVWNSVEEAGTFSIRINEAPNTWVNTSWTAGTPEPTDDVLLLSKYNTSEHGSLEVNNLDTYFDGELYGGSLIVANEDTVIVNGDLTNDGSILVESGGSLAASGEVSTVAYEEFEIFAASYFVGMIFERTVTPVTDQEINELDELSLTVEATDGFTTANGSLQYHLDETSENLGMSINAETGAFSWTPAEDQDGTHEVTVSVQDNYPFEPFIPDYETSSSVTFSITVNEVNVVPVLAELVQQDIAAGTSLSYQVPATDEDIPAQTLIFSIDQPSLDKGMTIDQNTGLISWTPGLSDYGSTSNVQVFVSDGELSDDAILTVIVSKADQVITFGELPAKVYGDTAFDLTATGGASGNTVTYFSSDETVATISGSTVTIVSGGTATITASQAGNDHYTAAPSVEQVLTVNQAGQTITFEALAAKTYGDADFDLAATGGASGNAVTFTSSDETVATISGSTVTIVGAGIATITASQSGNANCEAATDVAQTLTVSKASQTITFDLLAEKAYGDEPFELTASSDSGLPVSYTSSNEEVATISGSTVTVVGAGTTTITAGQAGNSNYTAATSVEQDLTVNQASQTITFAALAEKTYGDADFNLTATGGESGNAVTYSSSDETVATITGNTVNIVGAGTATITASQAWNDNYLAAESVAQELVVSKASQAITIDPIVDKLTTDAAFDVVASATSGLPLEYELSGPATLAGATISLTGKEGTVTVTVSQAGNENYLSASTQETFSVAGPSKMDQTITFNLLAEKAYGDQAFELIASSDSGLPLSYISSNEDVATISGSTVSIVGAGTATITASQAGDSEYSPAPAVMQTLSVQQVTLRIAAENHTITYGDPLPELTASYSGFVNGEDESMLTGVPEVTTDATAASNAGEYFITVSGGAAANYDFEYEGGVLTISKALASVILTDTEQVADGTAKEPSVSTDPAGLSYTMTFDRSTAAPTTHGEYEVVVTVEEVNYEGSATATFILTGEEKVLGMQSAVEVQVYPNPAADWLRVSGPISTSVSVYDLEGRLQLTTETNKQIDISELPTGIYLVYARDRQYKLIKK